MASAFLAKRADAIASIHALEDAKRRQATVRATTLSLLGGLPERTPLGSRTLRTVRIPSLHIEAVLFDSQHGFHVTALLYLPRTPTREGRLPAILITAGNTPAGKADETLVAQRLARSGFAVLTYDGIGEGERLQYADRSRSHTSLTGSVAGELGGAGLQPALLGDALARYLVWDAMRALDYLSQRAEVDPERIGVYGCSGGDTVAEILSTLDERVKATAVGPCAAPGAVTLSAIGPKEGGQSIPDLISSGLDVPDWIEASAPRPYAITLPASASANTQQHALAKIHRFYSLFDASASSVTFRVIPHDVREDPNPFLEDALEVFTRAFQPDAGSDLGALHQLTGRSLQVSRTGQVATSYPGAETVFTLNRRRAATLLATSLSDPSGDGLSTMVRAATGSGTRPGGLKPDAQLLAARSGHFVLPNRDGLDLSGNLSIPPTGGRHPAVILFVPDSIYSGDPGTRANRARFEQLAAEGNVVLAITPRPSPPGSEEFRSEILGSFYLLGLCAESIGRTIVGVRMDDIIRATDYMASRSDVDPGRITAFADGHMGLALLHAAIVDPQLAHITVNDSLASYRTLLNEPLPRDAPEDIIPGVLLRYDIPDLVKSLGSRVTVGDDAVQKTAHGN
jgi:cephalosporin-C deacetylase-like acetyl esterase